MDHPDVSGRVVDDWAVRYLEGGRTIRRERSILLPAIAVGWVGGSRVSIWLQLPLFEVAQVELRAPFARYGLTDARLLVSTDSRG